MRSLAPDEALAWGQVMATVKPLRKHVAPAVKRVPLPAPVVVKPGKTPAPVAKPARQAKSAPVRIAPAKPGTIDAATLDGGWDRRIARGMVFPDASLDLHGHTLASAHALLDHGLERAIARGDRVLLLVTGKPPRPESERPHSRGAIRAAVADWIAMSRHARDIAAVRGAHPRHGGSGALYIVLRRARMPA